MDCNDEIRTVLLELFEKEELIDQWLNSPKWYFDGMTPLQRLQEPGGIEAVLMILNRIRYGDFS